MPIDRWMAMTAPLVSPRPTPVAVIPILTAPMERVDLG